MNELQENSIEKENKRVQALINYEIMDTEPEVELDEITKIAYIVCDTTISLISLLDHQRQWFKSNHGLECCQTSKEISFCQYTIKHNDLFIVEDAHLEEEFKANPLVVGYPYIRFYAGMPLTTPSGYNIGTLCVINRKPKKISENQKFVLKALAKQVITNFELRKYNKELTRLNEKTMRLTRAKEEFFSNMSHELRTPLNAIYGFTDILGKTKLDDDQKEQLSIVKSSVEILISIINDILDYSKIETGNLKIENHPFNLRKLVKATYELLKIKAQEKNLSLLVSMSKNVPSYITGDKVRLNQILINLLGNAIKFTFKGCVTLSIKMIEESNDDIKIDFSVKDTGIGIPQDKLNSIFERFQQVEGTTRVFGGSGLGLSISKSLVELHNGRLKVTSEIGKGSEFSFNIKYQKSTKLEISCLMEDEKFKDCNNKPNFENMRILLVEDNAINVKLLKKVLDGTGIHLDTSENGKVCIEKLKNNNYDIILMDLYMPEMDGYEATKHIRTEMKLNTPIIGLSANISEIDKQVCIDLGMNDYITKPFKCEDLFRAICILSNKSRNSKTFLSHDKSNKDESKINQKISIKIINQSSSLIVNNLKNLPLVISKENMNKIKLIKPKYCKIKSESECHTKNTTAESINKKLESNRVKLPCTFKRIKIKENYDSINLNSLKEYSGEDKEFEKQLIELFLDEIPEYLKELECNILKEDYDGIKKSAHKIKSPLGIFSLHILLNKFQKIEELSLRPDIESITKIFNWSKASIEKILKQIRLLLKNYEERNNTISY